MKKLILLLSIASSACFAVTGNKVWRIPSAGSLGAWGPVNLADSTNAITGLLPRANIENATIAKSSTSGIYTNATTTPTDIVSVSFTSTGKPIRIVLLPDSASPSTSHGIGLSDTGTGSLAANILMYRDATQISQFPYILASGVSWSNPSYGLNYPEYIETPGAGTYTYKLQGSVLNTGVNQTLNVTNMALVVYEIL